jgi:hypothetical protein
LRVLVRVLRHGRRQVVAKGLRLLLGGIPGRCPCRHAVRSQEQGGRRQGEGYGDQSEPGECDEQRGDAERRHQGRSGGQVPLQSNLARSVAEPSPSDHFLLERPAQRVHRVGERVPQLAEPDVPAPSHDADPEELVEQCPLERGEIVGCVLQPDQSPVAPDDHVGAELLDAEVSTNREVHDGGRDVDHVGTLADESPQRAGPHLPDGAPVHRDTCGRRGPSLVPSPDHQPRHDVGAEGEQPGGEPDAQRRHRERPRPAPPFDEHRRRDLHRSLRQVRVDGHGLVRAQPLRAEGDVCPATHEGHPVARGRPARLVAADRAVEAPRAQQGWG